MKIKVIQLIALLLCVLTVQADTLRHGDIRVEKSNMVWGDDVGAWVTIEQFWDNYVQTNDGVSWESAPQYPPFVEVDEGDTFLVQLPSGVCLMEFFHGRWRRANDVRRWDLLFNEYAGCPYVFN